MAGLPEALLALTLIWQVFPKHYCRKYDAMMTYQMGATYGPEVDISFEPKQLRKVTTVRRPA
eukprot:966148-Prymnesium_polylepis.1